ncbi:MAG TPA: hypothetical protein DEB24_04340 [Coriobacteriia bacterium]|nr:hypothetical protein [Coriobacteriia bacterium]
MSYYCVYGTDGNVVERGGYNGRLPRLTLIDGDVVNIHRGVGTGIAWDRYYSLSRDVFSKTFTYVCAFSEECVAYIHIPDEGNPFGTRSLVIRNAFDRSEYYKEVQLDFSRSHTPVLDAGFINDKMQLKITYQTGDDFREVTEVIDLN